MTIPMGKQLPALPVAWRNWRRVIPLALSLSLLLASCGGTSGDGVGDGCTGSCVNDDSFLSVPEVQKIIAQAANEATAQRQPATIAVVDRVGNVLAVFQMTGAPATVTITSQRHPPVVGGLEGIAIIPATQAAIAKAVTGAYLSSEGNAFTTRTASQIIQQNFNVGEQDQPSGPLFGVQFSQLPCSDLSSRFPADGSIGPKRSPLGLAADPGGLPLYKNGTVVGGIGVIADGLYTLDLNIYDDEYNADEVIALAGTSGFVAPEDQRADRITVDGKFLRFTDVGYGDLRSNPGSAPAFAALPGRLVPVRGYTNGTLVAGTVFGQPPSGIAAADTVAPPDLFSGLDAFVLVDTAGNNRFPPRAGQLLNEQEVREVLRNALAVANRARAQIRRPLGSAARVTISVVDVNDAILGIARTRDAPIFGIDVSLQKARTAAFFSSPAAAGALALAPPAVYLNPNGTPSGVTITLGDYVRALRDFLDQPNALANGAVAYSNRAIGNIARPFFPDGIRGKPNGPFSKPFADWSPFSDGLQLDLVLNQLVNSVLFAAGAVPNDVAPVCTNDRLGTPLDAIRNGIQIFPGSVPIYKDGVLAGAIGVSGDGVDQDDMIAFLGLHNAGASLGTIGNAPSDLRANKVTVPSQGVNLRYVQCPQAPFNDSDDQNVCDGK